MAIHPPGEGLRGGWGAVGLPIFRVALTLIATALHEFVLTLALTSVLSMNPKIVRRTPHPSPVPIGSSDAEREKRSLLLDDGLRRVVQGFKARMKIRRNLSPAKSGFLLARFWVCEESPNQSSRLVRTDGMRD